MRRGPPPSDEVDPASFASEPLAAMIDVPWRTIIPLEKSLRLPPYGLLLIPIENRKAMEGVLPPHRLSKQEKKKQFQKTVEKLSVYGMHSFNSNIVGGGLQSLTVQPRES
jgi:hypothetical protein